MVQQYPPHPALRDFISRILLIRYELDPAKPRLVNPFPPQPEQFLNFYPYDQVIRQHYNSPSMQELPRSIMVGPQLSRVDLSMGYHMLVISIGFHPGGMHRLLGVPMHELLGTEHDAALLLGRDIEEVIEQLNEATEHGPMIDTVQRYLLKKAERLKRMLPLDRVLSHLIQHGSRIDVDALSQQACVSVRQLERQFKERIGMPPKLFSRLVRFSKAWCIRERNPLVTWSEIAHACHFADQMHMIRDFKDFVGVTPTILQADLEKSPLRLQGETGE